MLKYLALGAIRLYQTVLSPYKGFRCAYAACTGCASCSVLGYRAIRRFGVLKGIHVLRWRFEACSKAYVGHLSRWDTSAAIAIAAAVTLSAAWPNAAVISPIAAMKRESGAAASSRHGTTGCAACCTSSGTGADQRPVVSHKSPVALTRGTATPKC